MRGTGLEQCRLGKSINVYRTSRHVARAGRRHAQGILPTLLRRKLRKSKPHAAHGNESATCLEIISNIGFDFSSSANCLSAHLMSYEFRDRPRREIEEVPRGCAFPRSASFRKRCLSENRFEARRPRAARTGSATGHPPRKYQLVVPARSEGDPIVSHTARSPASSCPARVTEALNTDHFEASVHDGMRIPGMRKAAGSFVFGLMPRLGRAGAIYIAHPTGPQELERP